MPIPVAVQPYRRLGPFKVMHRENTVYYLSDMQNQRLAHGILGDILLPYTLAEEFGDAAAKDSADSLDEFNNGSSSGLSSLSTSSGGSSPTAGPSHFAGHLSSSTPCSKTPEYWPDGNTSNNGRDDNETGYLSSGGGEMGGAVLADNPERAVLLPELMPMPYIEQSCHEVSHLMSIPGLYAKGYKLKVLADTSAKVCLITEKAAKRAGLRVTTNSRPMLCALWPEAAPHHSIRQANICLCVDNGPCVWTHAVIIGFNRGWDILVGGKALKQLRIQLTSPAMDRYLNGSGKTTNHPLKTIDGPWRAQTAVAVIEDTYDKMPDTAPSHNLSFPSLTEASCTTPLVFEPVVVWPMCAHNNDFYKLDMLYPKVTKVSITERLHHQCETEEHAAKLLGELETGKGMVHEYSGSCPPPAAYAPIQPPMHNEAKTVYVIQHTLSEAACKARDEVVDVCLRYGIDKPSRAFVQLPIFTKSKLNTTEHRVLFDDNMASFFTLLCLADDVTDFWTYDGGDCGKLHNRRMVQENSESPAIVQAFILHVFSGIPHLQNCILAYIDNIYIKSTTGNMDKHIADVGDFIRCLADMNVTINMCKSLRCVTRNIEILGHMWSADCSWDTFDHRVETLWIFHCLPISVSSSTSAVWSMQFLSTWSGHKHYLHYFTKLPENRASRRQTLMPCMSLGRLSNWLSLAKERTRPDKASTSDANNADETIDSDNAKYVIGVLTAEESSKSNEDDYDGSLFSNADPAGTESPVEKTATPAADDEGPPFRPGHNNMASWYVP
ncbi:hypothetical protein COEREDRAFT_11509 [Coemansia reversa NRRL 1564]|uniref:Reverse transcriptase domain-containing protein n=1 Tax=Coemansia reversa (strain ATCC 12441 / NRRL 1564) TaxID=763665 RepID=A0A2G5B2U6_COERN|nr:hypothetical protein COEREDRAFT_11509 [Coemansia reversa NRRL 1564]|eukprot:PIA13343.1 hypothetical protein COEREDRAFT_11509 [Coemansia reversa NRRL 1564]